MVSAAPGFPASPAGPADAPQRDPAGPPRRVDTALPLALACGLIFNSHLEQFWPRSYLAADGLLGNSLFYLMSGFGIGSSLFARPQPFGRFLARRLVRIYPAALVAGLLVLAVAAGSAGGTADGRPPWSLAAAFRLFVWPTPFTYLRNIVAIYVIGYLLALPRSVAVLYGGLATAIGLTMYGCMHALADGSAGATLQLGSLGDSIFDAFDTALFLAGMTAAATDAFPLRSFRVGAAAAGVSCVGYFAVKYLMVVHGVGGQFVPALFLIVGVVSFLAVGVLTDPRAIRPLRGLPAIGRGVDLVAGLTLEIYVLHQTLIGVFPALHRLPFPVNIAVLAGITLVAAMLLQAITAPLRRRLDGAGFLGSRTA